MKIRILLFMLMVSFAGMSFAVHKHYISLTKIDFNDEEHTLQITMRFFLDDIENALESRFEADLKLATPQENEDSEKFIERYIKQKFKIGLNGSTLDYTFLGKEYENDEVFFYLEATNVDQIQSLEIQNSMLFEMFEEQQNYVKIQIETVSKTFILVKANDKEMLKLTSSN